MLQPVSLGQHRSICPGTALDGRGISLGRQLALFFPDLSSVRAFLATATHETSFEPILPSLEIVRTADHRGGGNWMVRFDVSDSYDADPFAQWARLHLGQVFTGSGTHLVPYRDRQAPTGYDLQDATAVVRGASGLVLYTPAGVQERHPKNNESLLSLTLATSLNSLPPVQQAQPPERVAFLVPQPLQEPFFRYCHTRGIKGHVLSVNTEQESVFTSGARSYHLVNGENVSPAFVDFMRGMPGIEVLIPVLRNVFVAWPNAHPFALDNLGTLFAEDKLYLFSQEQRLSVTFSKFNDPIELDHFTKKEFSTQRRLEIHERRATSRNLGELSIPIALTKNHLPKSHVDAAFIAAPRLPWLQTLLYNLPPHVLSQSQGALTEAGLFVVAPREAAHWPMGCFFQSAGADVFLPWGFHWVPRVPPEDFRMALDIEDDVYCFVNEDESVQTVKKADFQSLSRAVLAPFAVSELETMPAPRSNEDVPREIVHAPQSRFVLWRGMKWEGPKAQKALTSGKPDVVTPREEPHE